MSNAVKKKKEELLFKVVLIGDVGVGKTSIVDRYVRRTFTGKNLVTIGVDFAVKVIDLNSTTLLRLQLWDISGKERFVDMTRIYYKEAVGALLVFDLCSKASIETVVKWKNDLDKKVALPDGNPVPCVLLANKCDLPESNWVIERNEINELCRSCGCVAWIETSAKRNINVDYAADTLVNKIMENHKAMKSDNKSNGTVKLSTFASQQSELEDKSGGCCS